MTLTIIFLLIGVLVLGGGLYYLFRERDDAESRTIYLVTTLIGTALTAGVLLKIVFMEL